MNLRIGRGGAFKRGGPGVGFCDEDGDAGINRVGLMDCVVDEETGNDGGTVDKGVALIGLR